jgi:hypothetical protein
MHSVRQRNTKHREENDNLNSIVYATSAQGGQREMQKQSRKIIRDFVEVAVSLSFWVIWIYSSKGNRESPLRAKVLPASFS